MWLWLKGFGEGSRSRLSSLHITERDVGTCEWIDQWWGWRGRRRKFAPNQQNRYLPAHHPSCFLSWIQTLARSPASFSLPSWSSSLLLASMVTSVMTDSQISTCLLDLSFDPDPICFCIACWTFPRTTHSHIRLPVCGTLTSGWMSPIKWPLRSPPVPNFCGLWTKSKPPSSCP